MPKRIAIATWDSLKDLWMREPQAKDQRKKKVSLYEHWGVFSETWPTLGSMRNGTVYARPTWVPAMDDSACSYLPTPTARDHKDSQIRREPHRPNDTDTLSRALADLI